MTNSTISTVPSEATNTSCRPQSDHHQPWCEQAQCLHLPGADVIHVSAKSTVRDDECDIVGELIHFDSPGDEPADWISLDVYGKPHGERDGLPWQVLLSITGARRLHAQLGQYLAHYPEGGATR